MQFFEALEVLNMDRFDGHLVRPLPIAILTESGTTRWSVLHAGRHSRSSAEAETSVLRLWTETAEAGKMELPGQQSLIHSRRRILARQTASA
jgi:hypothetical protein